MFPFQSADIEGPLRIHPSFLHFAPSSKSSVPFLTRSKNDKAQLRILGDSRRGILKYSSRHVPLINLNHCFRLLSNSRLVFTLVQHRRLSTYETVIRLNYSCYFVDLWRCRLGAQDLRWFPLLPARYKFYGFMLTQDHLIAYFSLARLSCFLFVLGHSLLITYCLRL